MIDAGAYSITFAVETASSRLQKLIKKNLDLDKTSEAIEYTFQQGAIPCGFFMFGFPTETEEEMWTTVDYACNSKMLKASFWAVVPFPYTRLFEMLKEIYPDKDINYSFASDIQHWSKKPYYSEVSGIDVEKILGTTWRRFYLDPWRAYTILKRLPKNFSLLNGVYDSTFRGFLRFGSKEGMADMPDMVE